MLKTQFFFKTDTIIYAVNFFYFYYFTIFDNIYFFPVNVHNGLGIFFLCKTFYKNSPIITKSYSFSESEFWFREVIFQFSHVAFQTPFKLKTFFFFLKKAPQKYDFVNFLYCILLINYNTGTESFFSNAIIIHCFQIYNNKKK